MRLKTGKHIYSHPPYSLVVKRSADLIWFSVLKYSYQSLFFLQKKYLQNISFCVLWKTEVWIDMKVRKNDSINLCMKTSWSWKYGTYQIIISRIFMIKCLFEKTREYWRITASSITKCYCNNRENCKGHCQFSTAWVGSLFRRSVLGHFLNHLAGFI